jgi:hypothetical protein
MIENYGWYLVRVKRHPPAIQASGKNRQGYDYIGV